MDSVERVDVVALTRALVDIDSTTGREGEAGRWLADYLRGRGFVVTEQRVDTTRFNVIATFADPQVVLSTHFDSCRPSFRVATPATVSHGRGRAMRRVSSRRWWRRRTGCGAKAKTVWASLFVVGEERGSDGALEANKFANQSRFLIDG